METGQLLSWVVSIVGFTGFIFAGKKKWWSWYINLGCQILWGAYALVTGQLAFLVFAAAYFVIFGVNAYKWTKDHLLVKRLFEEGEQEHARKEFKQFIDDQDSNLVKHAYHELTLIGEDPKVIDWYIRVIKEYASFGHSGGSHMAIMPCLSQLLNFQPLSPLTNDPEEWYHHSKDMWDGDNGIWQNKRDGRMFSEDGGETYTCVDDPKDPTGVKRIYTSECNLCSGPVKKAITEDGKCAGCGVVVLDAHL